VILAAVGKAAIPAFAIAFNENRTVGAVTATDFLGANDSAIPLYLSNLEFLIALANPDNVTS